MIRSAIITAVGVLFLASPLCAQDNHSQLRAAQQSLEQARAQLKAAPNEYEGHRKGALTHVEKALEDIRAALASAKQRDRKIDRKIDKLEKKQDRLETQQEKLEGRKGY